MFDQRSQFDTAEAERIALEGQLPVDSNRNRTTTKCHGWRLKISASVVSALNLGIDPASKAILLVKSTNHFYAGFAPIAAEILYIDAGAPYPSNPRKTDYRKLPHGISDRRDLTSRLQP